MFGYVRAAWSIPFAFVMTFVLTFVVTAAAPRVAAAQGGGGMAIHVLAIDSDDADEQADALTTALRAHVRATPGWTLLETTQSLSMLTAAFRCPQHPDAACLERIAEKLKTEQFLWGVMKKTPGHQVTVEIHLWSRGKPDQSARESYSDNVKDSSDDGLKRVATDVFGRLIGVAGGTLVLHASADAGTVLVDGQSKATLDHGRATLSLPAGVHTVEVQAPGFATAKSEVTIQPSGNSQLEIVLVAATAAEGAPEASKPLPVRKIVEWSAIIVGGALIATGIGLGVSWLGDQSDLNTARQKNYGISGADAIQDPCNPGATKGGTSNGQTTAGCNAVKDAKTALAGEITSFAVGAVLVGGGIYLVVTDHPAAPASASPTASRPAPKTGLASVQVIPSLGPGSGSLLVLGRF